MPIPETVGIIARRLAKGLRGTTLLIVWLAVVIAVATAIIPDSEVRQRF